MLRRHHHHARMRARTFARVLACAVVLAATLAAVSANAAVYNPLNVISYDTWRASSSMSVADIQAFLDAQTGPLKSYACTDTITSAKPARRSAAQIIWRSAQAWNLNPKVILATLQKEQGLITLSNSANASRIKKAMGMGIFKGSKNRYPGFANQVFNGARSFSTYEIRFNWVPGLSKTVVAYKNVDATKTVDGAVVHYQKRVSYKKTIVPTNACTFALYTYTPYYPQKGFWVHYTHWFEDPLAPSRLQPVYRFRNKANGTYLYTASEAKRYTLIRTAARKWQFQGVSFTCDASATANTVPLYQMFNTRTHKYLYTVSISQRDKLLKVRPKQWRADGIVCYVAQETSGTAPVYRLEKKSTHAIVLTSSAALKKSWSTGHSSPFAARGIAFYLDSLEATAPVGPTP